MSKRKKYRAEFKAEVTLEGKRRLAHFPAGLAFVP